MGNTENSIFFFNYGWHATAHSIVVRRLCNLGSDSADKSSPRRAPRTAIKTLPTAFRMLYFAAADSHFFVP